MNSTTDQFGILAEFADAGALVSAARQVHAAGYRNVEAYSPLPVDGLAEALGFHRTRMPLIVLIGGMVGCLGGWALQYYTSVVAYPLNVGGRPFNSWPSFIPVIFEMTVLFAALFEAWPDHRSTPTIRSGASSIRHSNLSHRFWRA